MNSKFIRIWLITIEKSWKSRKKFFKKIKITNSATLSEFFDGWSLYVSISRQLIGQKSDSGRTDVVDIVGVL